MKAAKSDEAVFSVGRASPCVERRPYRCLWTIEREIRRSGGTPLTLLVILNALLAIGVGFGCWIGFQLVRQNGRILLRLEALEGRLGEIAAAPPIAAPAAPEPAFPPGLPIGSAAPDFDLPLLAGGRQSLSGLRGRRALVIFFSPRCGYCLQMAPDLAALPPEGDDGEPVPLVVTVGDADENRQWAEQYGVRCRILLQSANEVASAYQAGGTPMGYLIDEQGNIAREMAVGAQALLALARDHGSDAPHRNGTLTANGHDEAAKSGPRFADRSLSGSQIRRDGLPAGDIAPDFTLPRIDGGELSLAECRGRKTLVVFSDPHCGPCNELAPELDRLARETPDVRVVMVSRGDAEENRAKAAEHGLTFPIVLQKQWEISRDYGMFATPVAYLIDERGIIAEDVAVGMQPILDLMSGASAPVRDATRGASTGNGGETKTAMKRQR